MNKRKINNQKANQFSKKRKEIDNLEEVLQDLRSNSQNEIFSSHDQEEYDPFMGVEQEEEHIQDDEYLEEFDESENVKKKKNIIFLIFNFKRIILIY